MDNFSIHNPVTIVFGKGQIAELENLIATDKKILITYGGGSVFKNGVMDQVKKALRNHKTIEFGGIEANPDYETLMKAVAFAKDEKVDFILAVGGGSVLDGTKFIAANAFNNFEDPYKSTFVDMLQDSKGALPFASVITLPATGSEMNNAFVISWRAKELKSPCFGTAHTYPQFSIIDPEVTYTLPTRQVINGLVDTFVHVAEQYVTVNNNRQVQDYIAVGILKTVLEDAHKAIKEPKNYDIKSNIFFAATIAVNGLLSSGKTSDWSVHFVGHEFTAVYGIDHGRSLAPLQIADWKIRRNEKKEQLLHMAKNVFNINEGTDDEKIDAVINKTEEFFKSIGISTRFSDYDNINKDCADIICAKFEAQRITEVGMMGVPLKTIKEIINTAF